MSTLASVEPEPAREPEGVRVVDAIASWFAEVRAPLRESVHTTRAYRGDLGSLLDVAADQLGTARDQVLVTDLASVRVMRRVFGHWAEHGPRGKRAKSSLRRAHSTWTVFFEYLVSEELVQGSPMPGVGHPKTPKRLPKPFTVEAVEQIVRAVMDGTPSARRRDPWPELDRAIVVIDLITGARTAELLGANVEHVNRTPGSESVRVLGKGDNERTVPLEPLGLAILESYLKSRRERFPETARKRGVPEGASEWDWWPTKSPLFVDRQGERLREGGLRYLITLVYKAAGVEADRAPGALTHALRHTAASRVASIATVVELMQLFGWSSLSTPQNYIDATAKEIRTAAASNPVYALLLADANTEPETGPE